MEVAKVANFLVDDYLESGGDNRGSNEKEENVDIEGRTLSFSQIYRSPINKTKV